MGRPQEVTIREKGNAAELIVNGQSISEVENGWITKGGVGIVGVGRVDATFEEFTLQTVG